jgi:hypothetical protein
VAHQKTLSLEGAEEIPPDFAVDIRFKEHRGGASVNTATGTAFDASIRQPSRLIAYLIGLLCLQFCLAALLKVTEPKFQPVEPTAKLVAAELKGVTKITIENGDKSDTKSPHSVLLQKDQQGWKLPELFGCSASSDSVKQVLKTIESLKRGLPVSTTAGAAERFKVSSNNFLRLITFYSGDKKLASLYVGTSPAYRSAYVRLPDSNDIYTAELSEFEIPIKPNDWIDRNMVQVKPNDIQSVDFGTFKIEKNGKQWNLVQSGQHNAISDDPAAKVLDGVTGLTINSVMGDKFPQGYEQSSPALEFKLSLKSGTTVGFDLFKSQAKDKHSFALRRSDQRLYYEVPDWVVTPLTQVSPQSLLKKDEPKKQVATPMPFALKLSAPKSSAPKP